MIMGKSERTCRYGRMVHVSLCTWRSKRQQSGTRLRGDFDVHCVAGMLFLPVCQRSGTLACIIHEDSPVSGKMAKQVVRSGEKRGPPRAELDRARFEAIFLSDGE